MEKSANMLLANIPFNNYGLQIYENPLLVKQNKIFCYPLIKQKLLDAIKEKLNHECITT